jgi:hypothetical protein
MTIALCCVALPAAAEETTDFERVVALDQAAGEAFQAHEYLAAVDLLLEAQDLMPYNTRLYNIAVCYDMADHFREAADYYHSYIYSGGEGSALARARERYSTIRLLASSDRPRSTSAPPSDNPQLLRILMVEPATRRTFPVWGTYSLSVLVPLTVTASVLTGLAYYYAFDHFAHSDESVHRYYASVTCSVILAVTTTAILVAALIVQHRAS